VSGRHKPKDLPFAGYIRVSDTRGREETIISPEQQESGMSGWSERTGFPVAMCEPELDRSGRTMERPIFDREMERCRRGERAGILVYKSDRFARDTLGALLTLAELAKYGATFASASEPDMDYSTPAGMAFLQMLFVFAEFFSANIKEGWYVSQSGAIERGKMISPYTYLGYDFGPDGRLVPNEWSSVAAEVFTRRGEGESWGSIADWLNRIRAPFPVPRKIARGEESKLRAATEWTGLAVARMVGKRVYLGEASRYVGQDEDDRGPVVNAEAHPAIVESAEFEAAQADPTIAWGGAQDGADPWLLQGFVRCAGCRYSLSLGRGPRGESMLRCRAKHASGRCPEPASIKAETLTDYVQGVVLDALDGIAELVPDSRDRERLRHELEIARREYDELRHDTEARRRLGHDDWLDTLSAFKGGVDGLQRQLDQAEAQVGAIEEGPTRDAYLALSVDRQRRVLAGFIDCVMVRRSRGRGRNVDPVETRSRILWRGEAPDDLPRKRRANEIRPFAFEDDVEARVLLPQDGP
jgi:DNA invertase Pin-like site-specific DNA recombinase